jgi:prepilin peptidase CpaA
MTSTSPAIGIPFVVLMLLAATSDLKARHIPKAITVTGMVTAPVLWGLLAGPAAAVASIVGGALALVVGLTLFALGALGGGDAKLLAVTGAFLGPARLLSALVVIGMTGGLLGLAMVVARGRLLATLGRTWQLCLHLATLGRTGAPLDLRSPDAITVPYGVAIAAGALMTWFLFAPTPLAP